MDEFTWKPQYGTSGQDQYKVLKASYGGGYEQRVKPYGKNLRRTYAMRFTVLDNGDVTAIMAFLRGKAGTSFTWTDPLDGIQYYWTCENPQYTYDEGLIMGLTATFEQFYVP